MYCIYMDMYTVTVLLYGTFYTYTIHAHVWCNCVLACTVSLDVHHSEPGLS